MSPLLATVLMLCTCLASVPVSANDFVRLDFNLFLSNENGLGTVFLELFDDKPLTKANFLQYVDGGHYDGTLMHRLARNFVLQGGGFYTDFIDQPAPLNFSLNPDARVDLDGDPNTPNPNVPNEYGNTPVRSNLRGTVAMAKVGGNPDSATNQFFFNWKDNSANLDNQNGGFTVFGEVVGNGMTFIDVINAGLQTTNQNPEDPNAPGTRGPGPFGNVPFANNRLLTMTRAHRVNYFKSGAETTIPDTGLLLTAEESFIDIGAVFSGGEKIIVDEGNILGINSNIALSKSIENRGTLAPGLTIGAVGLFDYEQTSTGLLDIQLLGTTAGSDYDQVLTGGEAILDGTLKVSLFSNFQPALGDSFNIVAAAGGIQGDFDTLDLPELSDGLFWEVNKNANYYKLSVVAPDLNGDGTVDGGDLTFWDDEYGKTTSSTADGNGDGVVDGMDFLILQRNYGRTRPVASIQSVPEPATLVLLLLGALSTPRAMRRASRRLA